MKLKWQCVLGILLLGLCVSVMGAVKIETNPLCYSTGKLSAAEINKWFADNIKQEQYDIWFGKKNRLYLNGAWKFVRLTGMPKKNGEVQDTDFGEQNGFLKVGFDDSKWFNQPVPLLWRFKSAITEKDEKKIMNSLRRRCLALDVANAPAAVGWYRKTFSVPEAWKGGRVLLNFNAVTWRAGVYLNGKLLGVHTESHKPLFFFLPGQRMEESFQFDVTDELNFKGDNVLAVKVYSPFLGGGIWQEVYLEAVPRIYVERALVTPLPEKNAIGVKAFIQNTTGKNASINLTADIGPWKSSRYNFAKGTVQTVKGPSLQLKPGMNETSFELPVKNPQYWSPAKPYLYELTLKDQAGAILGKERFGYRTFRVGKNAFLLNGKPVFLRGKDNFPGCSGLHPLEINRFGILNRNNLMEDYLKNYMSCGFNYYRSQATYPVHIYHDLGDELGLISSVEEIYLVSGLAYHIRGGGSNESVIRKANGEAQLTKACKDAVKRRCYDMYNHPSICMFSCGNEIYDTKALSKRAPEWKKTGFGPYLRAIHDEFKKYDQTRPVTSASGRGPKGPGFGSLPLNLQTNKADFDDGHLYTESRSFMLMEDDNRKGSYKYYKDAYSKDNGYERPMIDGESFYFFEEDRKGSRTKFLGPHLDKNKQFDRKWLAENMKRISDAFWLSGKTNLFQWSMIPYRVATDETECLRIQGMALQKVIELERRKRKFLAGYVLHSPNIFDLPGVPNPGTFEAAQMAQQPVLASFNNLFGRNFVSGRSVKTKLYLLNDSEEVLNKALVKISLRDEDGKDIPLISVPFNALSSGGMAESEITLICPDKVRSGHCKLVLTVKNGAKTVSVNEYALYVLNRNDIKLSVKPVVPALYSPSDNRAFGKLLQRLGVKFKSIRTFSQLSSNDKVLIIPPGTVKKEIDTTALVKWVDAGGKVLVLEQRKMLSGLMPSKLIAVGGGFLGWRFSEIVLLSHPAFKGLHQDDFYFWNGNGVNPMSMALADMSVAPLKDCVVSMMISTNSRLGMTLCEARRGKGRFMFSQLKATDRFGSDSVATRYFLNLLNYTLGSFDDPNAPSIDQKDDQENASYKVNAAKTFFVDLKPYANMGFADKKAGDKQGGWTDQGPANDAHTMPTGKQTFAGVPFQIINPATNHGKSSIVLRGPASSFSTFLPSEVKRIMVGRKARKLFFLVAGAWVSDKTKESVAEFDIIMNIAGEGTIKHNVVELVPGQNYGDWWEPKPVPDAIIGWHGLAGTETSLKEVGAYVVEWVNQEPNVEVGWINFISKGHCMPILIAVTGEE